MPTKSIKAVKEKEAQGIINNIQHNIIDKQTDKKKDRNTLQRQAGLGHLSNKTKTK
jgi:hypothetical protein